MSTPAYFPPTVTAAGLTVPSYASILADNLQAFLNIYGTNQYVAPDSAIYQLLSILSLKQSDTMQALQLAYNQSSPQTAVGAGLDRQVKMNGLAREAFTYSTVTLQLTGTAGFVILNGFAQDQSGNLWSLPTSVTLVGSVTNVTAVCTTPGAVAAEPGTINIINTPMAGWATVTNPVAATVGDAVESDSSLRARQAVSVALPGLTPIASTLAAVMAADGVIRVAPGYPTPGGGPGTSIENPTGGEDSWGNPAHSISIVAQCTNTLNVAQAIYNKKTIGCFTNGTATVPVKDPNTGVVEDISFFQPTILPIMVLVTLAGYGTTPTTAVVASVQAALVTYLNELAIGETVSYGALFYEAMAVNASLIEPVFGVQTVLVGPQAGVTTATFSGGSTSVAVASAVGIAVGQLLVAAGLAAGTLVTAIAGTTLTVSIATLAAGTGVAAAFATLAAADVRMPNFYYAAEGVAANVQVVAS